jgi:hypothetical protein
MKEPNSFFDQLILKVQNLSYSTIELVKLKILRQTSIVLALFFTKIAALFTFALMLLFFSISFAIWLEKFTQKLYLGFLVVAVIYAFFGFVIILFMKKYIYKKILKQVSKILLNNK